MKILFTVEFYEPRKGGVEQVVKQLAEGFAKKGHQVSVATSYAIERNFAELNGVRVESFKLGGNLAKGFIGASDEQARYQQYLKGDFDVVINYAAQNWSTDLTFAVLSQIKAKKVLIPCGYSGLRNPVYQSYFAQLPAYLRQYDSLVYMSMNYQDKVFGDEHGVGEKAVYIPNGASADEFVSSDLYRFRERAHIQTKYLAITIANFYAAKGQRFVIKAFKKMHRKDVTLALIGELPTSRGIKKLAHILTGYLPCWIASLWNPRIKIISGKNRAEVLSAYKNADLFLFGSRVECAPLVMYESFASKVPFITRPVGNVADHKDYLSIVQTPEEMAHIADRLLNDDALRHRTAQHAFELWDQRHRWEIIVDMYEQLVKKISTQR